MPEGDSSELYSIAADGSYLTWLTNGNRESALPSWRPGSGDRFDPGSCDPDARPALVDVKPPTVFPRGPWLGARYRGLLLSRRGRWLGYSDCERFDPSDCPPTISVGRQSICRRLVTRALVQSPHRLLRRRGELVAYYDREAVVSVLSGDLMTTIDLQHGNPLRPVRAAHRGQKRRRPGHRGSSRTSRVRV